MNRDSGYQMPAAPTFGPVWSEPDTPAAKASAAYPLWWWPPFATIGSAVSSLTLAVAAPAVGTAVLGVASAGAFIAGIISALGRGGSSGVTGGAFITSGATLLGAAGCDMGVGVTAGFAALELVAAVGTMVPKWQRAAEVNTAHRHAIEQERMRRQYDYAQLALQQAGRHTELELLAKSGTGELGRIEAELKMIEANVAAAAPHIGSGTLTSQAQAALEQQMARRAELLGN